MTDLQRELAECPFCGSPAEIDTQQSFRAIVTARMEEAVAIYCTSCSAQMMHCYSDHPGTPCEDLEADLIAAWNRRQHHAAIAEAVQGWRPIESAPKDGSRILATIKWVWSDGSDGEAQDVIYWYAGGCFWVCGTPMNYVQGLDDGVEPTHWMPLPAPPAKERNDG